jgi:hypothetical protein
MEFHFETPGDSIPISPKCMRLDIDKPIGIFHNLGGLKLKKTFSGCAVHQIVKKRNAGDLALTKLGGGSPAPADMIPHFARMSIKSE